MALSSRQDLKEYCLRSLGAPVVNINVDDEQLEDRLDEALEYWRLYHPEGIEQVYAKYLITASTLTLTTNNAQSFVKNDALVGSISGAKAMVVEEGTDPAARESTGNTLLVANVVGTFVVGDIITGSTSGVSATVGTLVCVKGIYDNHYITLPNLMYGVTRVIPMAQASSSKNMFDLQYQLRLHDLYDVTSTSMVYYKTVMQHLDMLDFELNAKPDIRFNRFTNQLHLDIKWQIDGIIGQNILVDGYGALDPADYPRLYNEIWLKHYTTALFKKMWGTNLKKFGGLQLPGGVTIDGQGVYDEAVGEIKDLEEELMNKSAPLNWFMG
jgi:hypothetical protein